MEYPKPGDFSRRKSGQRKCDGCNKMYNNRATPERCSECDTYLGGTYVEKLLKLGAVLITSYIVSVRLSEKKPDLRTFVYLGAEKKVIKNIVISLSLVDQLRVCSFTI